MSVDPKKRLLTFLLSGASCSTVASTTNPSTCTSVIFHVDGLVDLGVLQISFEDFGFGQGLLLACVPGDYHRLQGVAGISCVVRGALTELVVSDAGSAVGVGGVC